MCGIAGIAAPTPLDIDLRARAVRMRDVMTHRGPDDAGLWADGCAVLAHRRLSIVDLAGGAQPLSNEDGRVWVTYNGEIYNHHEVRAELERCGHRYRTRCDTETIVHAYEQWGDESVHRFRGMFAFGLWDAPARRLLLVRDRLGVKPLYWALAGDRLVFASEIKGILASGLVAARPNLSVLSELLATRFTSGPDTLFEGIYKLLPGHRLAFEHGRVRIAQYWDVPLDGPDPELERLDDRTLVERFRALLAQAVRLRLMADVPLGAFLSGGIDSAAVVALMAREMRRPVQTFSVAFAEPGYNEIEYARRAARAIDADPHEIVIDDDDFFGALPRLIWHEDEPIAHPSSVPLHFVSALARRHVKVVLTGEGSDELLAGYGRYPRALANWTAGGIYERLVPEGLRSAVIAPGVSRLPGRIGRLARRSFLVVPRRPAEMFLDNFAGVPLALQRTLLHASVPRHHPYASALQYFHRANGASGVLDRLLYTDLKTYLVELLMKQDQMSMSMSIESRVPFLDHVLVEFAARLPHRLKLDGFSTKRILRRAVRDVVPGAILSRPKMGFPVPFGNWVGARWNRVVREVLLDRRTRERGIIDPVATSRLLDDHRSGRRSAGDALWALLNLELWYRTFVDGGGVQTLAEPGARSPRRPSESCGANPPGSRGEPDPSTGSGSSRASSRDERLAPHVRGSHPVRPAVTTEHQP